MAAGLGGHVIKTGCAPYLIDWIQRGVLRARGPERRRGHSRLELALAGKTSENVVASAPGGTVRHGPRDGRRLRRGLTLGAENELGLGAALGQHLEELRCPMPIPACSWPRYRAGIPCTVHVALGTDIVHMHPHVSGAALGEASLIDFRRLCSVVATCSTASGSNLGSAVMMPEVFVKAVAVARNFGRDLDGLVTVNLDKQVQYRSRVNVVDRPSAEGSS